MKKNRLIFCVLAQFVFFGTNCFAERTAACDSDGSRAGTQQTMTWQGHSHNLLASTNSHTPADFSKHDLVVVDWNVGGNTTGINAAVLSTGITGGIMLTNNNPAYHSNYGCNSEAAGRFLTQAISCTTESQTGPTALGDHTTAFSYLPSRWDISTRGRPVLDVESYFTAAGLK